MMKHRETSGWLLAAAVLIVVSLLTRTVAASVIMTAPNERYGKSAIGAGVTYKWTGGDADTHLQLWAGDPHDGWRMVAPAVPATDGQYYWSDMVIGLFSFGAWVDPGGGEWYYVEAPEVQLLGQIPYARIPGEPNGEDISLISAPIEGDSVVQGENYLIEYANTIDGSRIQFWAGDAMIDDVYIHGPNEGYLWDTSDMAPGRYVLSAWCTYGGFPDWYYITAPGVLEILPAPDSEPNVPEPASATLLIAGLSALVAKRRGGR